MRVLDGDGCPPLEELVATHVALPESRPAGAALVRLNMIASADGGSALAGRSGGLGNRDDHEVFGALRERADVVIVGMGTAVSENYHAPESDHLEMYVVASRPDISGNDALFASGRVTLVLPEDAAAAPSGVRELRIGGGGMVDLRRLVAGLAGKVVAAEGGPTLAGRMVALGLVDELFLTVSPRVISGPSQRVVHGPDADPELWRLHHGFVDDEGFLFLRYAKL
jgi:riboflavin biosynthesis pyrimidine reductase